MEKIVIAGGTGLVGQALIPALKRAGYDAVALRRPYNPDDLTGANAIINLAGENISAGRWTSERKRRILDSRVQTLNTLRECMQKGPNTIGTLISASASGYYGTKTSIHTYSENDPPGDDFLAWVCREWESAADAFIPLGIRVAKVRTGVVLSEKGGALPKLMMPLKFGFSIPLGSGKQWLPWIHIDDFVRVIVHLVENSGLSGAFNAAAPNPVTNRQFMKQLAISKHRVFIPIGVPSVFLKLMLGEMSAVTLEGSRLSVEKLIRSGFEFNMPELVL